MIRGERLFLTLLTALLLAIPAFGQGGSREGASRNIFRRADGFLKSRQFSTKGIDTLFLAKPHARWLLKTRTNLQRDYAFLSQGDNHFVFNGIGIYSQSITAGYRGLSLTYTFMPKSIKEAKRSFDMGLRYQGNKFGIEAYFLLQGGMSGRGTLDGRQIQVGKGYFNPFKAGVDGYYVFNASHFSLPAALGQSMIQLRSSGSAMLVAGLQVSGFLAIPDEDTDEALGAASLYSRDFYLGGGYGYNWVPSPNWLIHASATLAFAAWDKTEYDIEGKEGRVPNGLYNNMLKANLALSYSFSDRYFAGFTLMLENGASGTGKMAFRMHAGHGLAQIFFGVRL